MDKTTKNVKAFLVIEEDGVMNTYKCNEHFIKYFNEQRAQVKSDIEEYEREIGERQEMLEKLKRNEAEMTVPVSASHLASLAVELKNV